MRETVTFKHIAVRKKVVFVVHCSCFDVKRRLAAEHLIACCQQTKQNNECDQLTIQTLVESLRKMYICRANTPAIHLYLKKIWKTQVRFSFTQTHTFGQIRHFDVQRFVKVLRTHSSEFSDADGSGFCSGRDACRTLVQIETITEARQRPRVVASLKHTR